MEIHVDSIFLFIIFSYYSSFFNIPTLWLYSKPDFDIDNCINIILNNIEKSNDKILLACEPIYTEYLNDIYNKIINNYSNLIPQCDIRFCNNTPIVSPYDKMNLSLNNSINPFISNDIEKLIYIGNDNEFLNIMKLKYAHCSSFYWYNVNNNIINNIPNLYKELNKRYCRIEKIKDSQCICLLLLDINIRNLDKLIEKMKLLIENQNKTCYTIVMSKVNETKLLNFPLIDSFVVCGSPLSILLHFPVFFI